MFFPRWRKWLNRTFGGFQRGTGRTIRRGRALHKYRLSFEQLEHRLAPAGSVTAFLTAVTSPANAFVPAAANAGDTLNYTAVITNNTGATVTGVNYNGTPLDGNTTLVPGSIHASPIANDDIYNWVGNTTLDSAAAGLPGLFASDTAPLGEAINPVSHTTPAHGSVTINANGSFVYTPNAGHFASDSFSYTIDNTAIGTSAESTAIVTINFAGSVWYVNSAAPAGGSGTIASPFQTLAAAASAATSGDTIFLYGANTYTGPITLNANEKLIGQGTDLTFDTGFKTVTIVAAGTGNTPTINNTVTLATGDTLKGFNISSGANTGLAGSGGISAISVNALNVTTTKGTAVNLNNVGGSFTFTSISANGGSNGIVLNNTTGSFTVTGDGNASVGGDASGGTLHNISTSAIQLTNVQNVSLKDLNIQNTDRSGINGTGVTNFSFTNGTVNKSGSQNFDANIAFNTTNFSGAQTQNGNNINGTLTVTDSVLSNGFAAGLDIQSDNGTLTNANVSNNAVSNPDVGTAAISFVGTGNATTSFSLLNATINHNTVTNAASGGIQVSIGNSNASGPGATAGIPNDPAHVIAITNNAVSLKTTGTNAIIVANSGGNSASRTQTNLLISGNGRTVALGGTAPGALGSSSIGTVILIGNNGFSSMTGTVDHNVITASQTSGGGNGIAGGNGVSGAGNQWTPLLKLTVSNNTISGTNGNGILLAGRGTSGQADLTITNNNVAAPNDVGSFATEGIRVDAGNASSANDQVNLSISGNASAGQNGASGIGVRKQGTVATTNVFGLVGIPQNPPSNTDVQNFINAQNPSGGGTDIISGSSYVQGSFTVLPTSPLTVSPNALSAATVGSAVNQTITASGGTAPFTFSVAPGSSLPPGLSLSSAGVLSGTPTAGGSFSFTVAAVDSAANRDYGAQSYTLTVNAPTITLGPASLAGGTVGAAYSQTITASGSTTPFHFTISTGSLPPGLFLNQDTGVISGVPTTASGSPFSFTVQATDSSTGTGPFSNTKNYSISVANPTVSLGSINVGSLPGAAGNKTETIIYAAKIHNPLDNPANATTFTTQGTVTGSFTGSPLLTDDPNDANGTAGTDPTVVHLLIPPQVTTQPVNATTDVGFNASFTAHATTGYPTPTVQWQQDTGSGFANLSNGTVGGVTYAGVTTDTLTITGATLAINASHYRAIYTNSVAPNATSNSVMLTVNPDVSITTGSLPNGVVSVAYNATVKTTGGTTPLTFSVSVGSLPHNLSLNTSTGAITGTPDTPGSSTFTIKVQSAGGSSDTHQYTVAIAENADLELTATAATPNPVEGGNLTYNVSIVNNGPSDATNVVLTDVLPAGVTLVSSTGFGTPSGTSTVTWNLGTIANGSTRSGTVTVMASDEGSIANPFSVTSDGTDSDSSPNDESVTVNSTIGEGDTLSAAGVPAISTPEGQAIGGNTLLATFTTTYLGNVAGDFTATIDWGDGSAADTGVVTAVAGQPGHYTVKTAAAGSHTYTDEMAGNITVTIKDDAPGTATATAQTPVTVTEADQLQAAGVQAISTPEGTGIGGNTLLATFTTTYLGNVAADFTATIDWGDGSSAATGVVAAVAGQPGHYTVSTAANGGHTYSDEHSAGNITVTIKDDTPGTATATAQTPVTVTEADQLQAAGVQAISVPEGQGVGSNTVVATFTTTYLANVAGDFIATIDWGDGSATETGIVAAVAGQPGHYTVSKAANSSHTYADEGTTNITVTVKDDVPGTATAVAQTPITITEADVLNASAVQAISVAEGAPVGGNTVVATFTSTFLGNVAADFVATIDWGDGSATATGVVAAVAGQPGHYTVSTAANGGHTYTDERSGNITVTIKDDVPGTATAVAQTPVTVTEADQLQAAGVQAISLPEGQGISGNLLLATFNTTYLANVAADFTASIDWGDGSPAATGIVAAVAGQPGHYTVSTAANGGHTYTDERSGNITVTIKDDMPGTATAVAQTPITVTEADSLTRTATNVATTESKPFSGQVASFTDSTFPSNSLSDFTATIDWGDGTTPSAGTVSGQSGTFTVSGTHTYAEEGSFTVKVTLTDDAPGTATATVSGTATVADQPVSVKVSHLEYQAGVNVGTGTIGSFTDPAGAEALSAYTADIAWGDGFGVRGVISFDSASNTFSVRGGHVYGHEGNYTVTITVYEDNVKSGVSTNIATIADAPVFITSFTPPPAHPGFFSNQVATFVDDDKFAVTADFQATIDWGDGTTSAGTIYSISYDSMGHPNLAVFGTHTYMAAPTGFFRVTITDLRGGTTTSKANDGMGALEYTVYFDATTGTYKFIIYRY
jgi:uncharacterized repeat protein (TIGR01451 family)